MDTRHPEITVKLVGNDGNAYAIPGAVGIVHNLEQALDVQATIGFPAVLRPSFTLGGTGGGIAYNKDEFVDMVKRGLELSPTHEMLIEESLLG